jgi:hypothetical protein
MTARDKIIRDIDTLKETVRLDWRDLATLNLQPSDRAAIRRHIDQCIMDLTDLRAQVDPDHV